MGRKANQTDHYNILANLLVMQKQQLVKMINKILREPWDDFDTKNGKEIHCMPSWISSLKEIIPLYSDKGWIVEKRVAISSRGRQLSLNFKNPTWNKNN